MIKLIMNMLIIMIMIVIMIMIRIRIMIIVVILGLADARRGREAAQYQDESLIQRKGKCY